MNEITGFTFFSSYYECLKDLNEDDRRDLLDAIVDYIFVDKEPEFTGIKRSIWILMKPNLTTSKNKSKNAKKETKDNQKKNKSKSKRNQKEISDLHDKDKEKDKDKNKEEEIEDGDIIIRSNNNKDVFSYFEENFGRTIASIEYEKINQWQEEFDDMMIKRAINECVLNNARVFRYLEGILNNWKSNNLKTESDVIEFEKKFHNHNRGDGSVKEIFDYNWLDDNDE